MATHTPDDCPVHPTEILLAVSVTRGYTRKMPTLDFKFLCYKMQKTVLIAKMPFDYTMILT